VDALRDALRQYRRVLLQLPTGGGKTAIASYLAQQTVANGRRFMFICHRAELVEQTHKTWEKYGIPHGFVAAGRPSSLSAASIASVDTLKNRLAMLPEPDVCVWDECHHLGAAGWQLVMDHWQRCRHVGLTATPWRLDGTGLGRQFDHMVRGPSVSWLMERGFLSAYEVFAPNPPDMKGARRQRDGEFSKREASARMDMPKRTGDIVAHWRKYADGMRTVAFAVNRDDSRLLVQRFNDNGIPAAHLDGDTERGERKRIIQQYARGELFILSNVGLFGEGFDLSAIAQTDVTIDCLIDAAASNSLAAVMQRWGRVLRPKSYPAIILDHAGNTNRHGFPDDEREWTLADRERSGNGASKSDGPPPPYTCTCFRQIRRPLPPSCPHCGKSLEREAAPIEEAEGELKRLTAEEKESRRARMRREEAAAVTLHDLIRLANDRGYANPTGWALKKFQSSSWRKQYAASAINARESA